jgi:NADPH-dependent glutamate synthase beta subunit-like oxidoreductase
MQKGKKVLVIGGGDTGSDCVGTAIRQKAERLPRLKFFPSHRKKGKREIHGHTGPTPCVHQVHTSKDVSAAGAFLPKDFSVKTEKCRQAEDCSDSMVER